MTKKRSKIRLENGKFFGLYLKKDHRKKFWVENRKFFGKYLKNRSSGIWCTRKCYLQKSSQYIYVSGATKSPKRRVHNCLMVSMLDSQPRSIKFSRKKCDK